MNSEKYNWKYCSLGGEVRVDISTGEDIAHLGELDQKLWTVLSCPVNGLDIDRTTLEMIDADSDGKIKVGDVVGAADWLCSYVKDKDSILKGESVLSLDNINVGTEAGKKLHGSALQILKNLKLDKKEISIDDTSDGVAIFEGTALNGDGIVTAISTEDEALKAVIAACVDTVGSVKDRGGLDGVNAELVEKFYSECADYVAWRNDAEERSKEVFPYGENTAAAYDACNVLKDKIADYFMRCKLIGFDESVTEAVDVSAEKIGAIREQNLDLNREEISLCPIARPRKEKILPFEEINPAWESQFAALKSLVLDVDFKGAKGIDESQWKAVLAKFDAFLAWKAAEKGCAVEKLGPEAAAGFLKEDRKADLLELIAADEALRPESESIDDVNKLMHLYRDFAKLLRNYVTLVDFYDRERSGRASFEAGELYIDQRCCRLCIKVEDMGAHADMAKLSGMFLIYCSCTSKAKPDTMNIVAVLTAGNIRDIRPGKNAIFYDRDGYAWDAQVTKVVDNPISVRQAFWSPYRKLANFINEKIDKSAAEKDSAAVSNLVEKADNADIKTATEKKPAFDIAKFAGIFAAIGMAFGYIGSVLKDLIAGVSTTPLWKTVLLIVVLMLVISGPACFIAWKKLRRRNLGPVLNANGWAVNSVVLVNILFGATLTNTVKYPVVRTKDPFKKVTPWWRKLLRVIIALAVVVGILYLTDNLGWAGYPRHKAVEEEPVEEVVETVEAEAEESVVEEAPAEAPVENDTE